MNETMDCGAKQAPHVVPGGWSMRISWGFWGVRLGTLLAVFGFGFVAAVVAPRWVQAQPGTASDATWPDNGRLTSRDLNRLAQRVAELERRMNTPTMGPPTPLTSVSSTNNPATYAAVSTPSLVTLTPTGGGFANITYEASFGTSRIGRVSTGGDSTVIVVPANQTLTLSASLGGGASPSITVTRFALSH